MYIPLKLNSTDKDGCGAPIGRRVPDHDTVTLADYRIRHALYRTDKDALANHQIFPWIPTWDDVLVSFLWWLNVCSMKSQIIHGWRRAQT